MLKLFCKHKTLFVSRWHASKVTPEIQPKMAGKELYIDRRDVHCFIQCSKCGHVFETAQKERLLEQTSVDSVSRNRKKF